MVALVFLPLLGALIGWLTNRIAIKSLFRPYTPLRIPYTNISIQGLLPKRRKDLADSIGSIVEEELISVDELLGKIDNSYIQDEVLKSVSDGVKKWTEKKLPGIVPQYIKAIIYDIIMESMTKEFAARFPVIISSFVKKTQDEINIKEIVKEKINTMPLGVIEDLVLKVASKELKQIEILGAILGFLIGIVQVMIIIFLPGLDF